MCNFISYFFYKYDIIVRYWEEVLERVEVLFNKEKIKSRVIELAAKIEEDYSGDVFVIGILKGACVFASDLIREIDRNIQLDFISVSSYGKNTTTSGVVKLIKDLDNDIQGKDVIIVEDIVDTGLTLAYLKKLLTQRKPKSIKICTLLDKKCRRESEVSIDYVGFEIDDFFVVGYGIDYAEKYRNLPYIGHVIME